MAALAHRGRRGEGQRPAPRLCRGCRPSRRPGSPEGVGEWGGPSRCRPARTAPLLSAADGGSSAAPLPLPGDPPCRRREGRRERPSRLLDPSPLARSAGIPSGMDRPSAHPCPSLACRTGAAAPGPARPAFPGLALGAEGPREEGTLPGACRSQAAEEGGGWHGGRETNPIPWACWQ